MKNKIVKRVLMTLLIIVGLVFINGCYFVFHGQFKATEKVLAGKDLNAYETFSTYCMHTACWMFGWVISPETARLVFCKQFFIDPNPKNYKVHDDERLKEIR